MHLDLTKNSFPCSSTPILQNHTNQSNLSLQDHHTVPGLWMAQSGRTPRTKTCQAEHSCLAKPKLNPLTASITAGGQGVTLSGLRRAELWPCSWGCQSSKLSVLLVTPSTDLISQFFSHKDECAHVCTLTVTYMHIQVYLCTSPTKNLTYKESIIYWGTATREVTQRKNNKCAPLCASFLHEI